MKLAIQPKTTWLPGKGSVVVNQLEVRVSSYQLGTGAQAFYDLQKLSAIEHPEVPAVPAELDTEGNIITPEVPAVPARTEEVTESFNLNGNVALTPEQFAAWGKDDDWFARCVAQNLDLFPITTTNE